MFPFTENSIDTFDRPSAYLMEILGQTIILIDRNTLGKAPKETHGQAINLIKRNTWAGHHPSQKIHLGRPPLESNETFRQTNTRVNRNTWNAVILVNRKPW